MVEWRMNKILQRLETDNAPYSDNYNEREDNGLEIYRGYDIYDVVGVVVSVLLKLYLIK